MGKHNVMDTAQLYSHFVEKKIPHSAGFFVYDYLD